MSGPSSAPQPGDDDLMTTGEVARMFRVDPKTVNRWAHELLIPCIRTPGGHRRYRRGDMRALLAQGTAEVRAR